jgi:hypothetical protein
VRIESGDRNNFKNDFFNGIDHERPTDGRHGASRSRRGLAGMELCVVEISTLDQLSCDGVFYNWNEVGLHFIRGKGPAYFRWWREVTDVTRRKASAEAVAQVLDTIRGNGEAVRRRWNGS